MTRQRIKHTFPPPQVCSGCWWETRLKELEQQHKTLRAELIRSRAERLKEQKRSGP